MRQKCTISQMSIFGILQTVLIAAVICSREIAEKDFKTYIFVSSGGLFIYALTHMNRIRYDDNSIEYLSIKGFKGVNFDVLHGYKFHFYVAKKSTSDAREVDLICTNNSIVVLNLKSYKKKDVDKLQKFLLASRLENMTVLHPD